MLHELLLTLCGHSGDIFVPWPQALPTTYAVAPDFPLLHPAERTALNRLARIGFNYASIRTFIDAQKENVWDAVLKDPRVGPGSIRPGFYLLALCGGLEEVLEGYMDVVVEAERKVLSSLDLDTDGARTPLSYFTYVFGKYQILLPQLLALLKTLEAAHTSYHGAKILDLLHSSCKSGLSEVREVVLRLFQSCMAVFYRQLVGWMLYGSLTDPHDEFFVQRGDLVKHGTGDNQLQLDRTRWQSQYVVEQRLVPDFIPESMAATILFIGKAVVTIKESKRPERARIAALITKHVTPLSKLSETSGFRPLEFQTAVNNVKEDVAAILWDVVVMDEHLVSHLKAFKECYLMGSGDLWMGFIEECGKLRMKANSRLSLVTDHELNSTFRSLLQNLGTAGGDLLAEHFRFKVLRSEDPGRAHHSNISGINFRLEYIVTWPLDLVFTETDIDRYNDILSFLLNLKSTHMRVQRVCSSISQSFRVGNASNRNRKSATDTRAHEELPRELWQLRARMMFLLDCLWSYVQMDVLEASFQSLLADVTQDYHNAEQNVSESSDNEGNTSPLPSTDPPTTSFRPSSRRSSSTKPLRSPVSPETRPDFEDIQFAHQAYVDAVCRGCFLTDQLSAIRDGVRRVLASCEQFCGIVDRIMSAGEWGSEEQVQDAKAHERQISSIRQEFDDSTSFLFMVFSGVQGTSSHSPLMSQLLLRMDFNKWYSLTQERQQETAR